MNVPRQMEMVVCINLSDAMVFINFLEKQGLTSCDNEVWTILCQVNRLSVPKIVETVGEISLTCHVFDALGTLLGKEC